jgi:hypothetical protein
MVTAGVIQLRLLLRRVVIARHALQGTQELVVMVKALVVDTVAAIAAVMVVVTLATVVETAVMVIALGVKLQVI